MDIQYIREFIKLAETESYAACADQMFISQSSLFKHIKAIENELGVELFEKEGKHIKLGEYGKLFLDYAETIAQLDSRCKKKIQSKLEINEERIRIWTNYHIGDLAIRFHNQHEEYLLDIRQGDYSPKQVSAIVENRAFDIYFLVDISEIKDELICMPYLRERLVLVVNIEHPLADREVVSMSELAEENFILFHDYGTKEGKYNPHNQIFTDIGFTPKCNMKASRGSEIVKLVQNNLGIAILSEKILEKKSHEGISCVTLEPELEYTVWCCYHKDIQPVHGAELLLEFCKSNM